MSARTLFAGAGLSSVLFAFWLLMSGIYTPFLVMAGLAASVAVAAVALRMEGVDSEGFPLRFSLAPIAYWPWLLKEMMVSGWRVALVILDPRLPVTPVLVRFRPLQEGALAIATHANSITLTPGTITVEAGRDGFLVHALTRESGHGLEGSEMDRRIRRLEVGR